MAAIVDLFGNAEPVEDTSQEELNSTLMGRYAEFMVCAQICKAGYHVTHIDSVGFDLVICTDDGSYTIQVKSTSTCVEGRCTWGIATHREAGNRGTNTSRGSRRMMPSDADLLALYHHIYGTTLVMPVNNNMPWIVQLPVHQVKQSSLEATLASALDVVRRR